jgi:hypothetical protein
MGYDAVISKRISQDISAAKSLGELNSVMKNAVFWDI